jgi:hypothetical protein
MENKIKKGEMYFETLSLKSLPATKLCSVEVLKSNATGIIYLLASGGADQCSLKTNCHDRTLTLTNDLYNILIYGPIVVV